MPQLATLEHEAFARAIVAGCSLTEAAKRAGHHKGAPNFGSRLMEQPQIAQRIIELQAIEQNQLNGPRNSSETRVPSQALETYTDKAWIVTELVSIERLARKLKDVSGMHACVKTLAQIGGHLTPPAGGGTLRDPATLALLGVKEVHTMLSQFIGSIPRSDKRKLLTEAPELAELVGDVEDEDDPVAPADERTPEPGV